MESAGPTDGGCTQYQYIQVEIVLYQGQPDGLFHGLVRWALGLAGCIGCRWGCTR